MKSQHYAHTYHLPIPRRRRHQLKLTKQTWDRGHSVSKLLVNLHNPLCTIWLLSSSKAGYIALLSLHFCSYAFKPPRSRDGRNLDAPFMITAPTIAALAVILFVSFFAALSYIMDCTAVGLPPLFLFSHHHFTPEPWMGLCFIVRSSWSWAYQNWKHSTGMAEQSGLLNPCVTRR